MHEPIETTERIERYGKNERTNHWLVAICFVLAALSGLALLHPAMFWLTGLFGGGPWTRILHPFIGLAMALGFLFLALHFAGENHVNESDKQWMRQWRDVVDNREDRLPEVGRYNAGQKVLFWALVILMLILVVTGFMFWRPWFAHLLPIWAVRGATLLHSIAAVLLIICIIVHVYAAIWVKGSMRAMMQGWVSGRWARRHHAAWYRQVTKDRS
ncbi:Formate dehydrogenase, cytochrome b556(fdo) subunit [Usitatibacter rugosus]|uniref:Formate dehydrogenase, cytochrome b556(Fdo) subunit n=1 Tax=Usitatibacter rugosus TaxID=2732067 RepID=A0A6M4GPY5_9PROT|nr:formate dehydrogenase subunit gamma [Usitatibacter rugosus]QJR09281.1 Formate dehydrogenase, cytochrome b556(fdo) subunit [Usitatibacter rugosus]